MPTAPDFMSRDPLAPGFWDERFEKRFTPWDRGGVSEDLRRFIADSAKPLTVAKQPPAVAGRPPAALLPGCGSAYELLLMCEAGWIATAIDFSPVAVARARELAGPWADRIVEADFFTYEPSRPLDAVIEQAFLCALPRARWPEVARRWEQLLAPGGLLAGYFYFDDAPKGPPFGITREQLEALLTPGFECIVDGAVADSIPVFAGKERWMVWRRR
jgi:SAM-dependent methyltransferase